MVVVTQHYHEGRSPYTAKRLGIKAVGVSALPRRSMTAMRPAIREFLSREKLLCSALETRPTFLGDKIDITGDGRLSHTKAAGVNRQPFKKIYEFSEFCAEKPWRFLYMGGETYNAYKYLYKCIINC